MLNLDCMVHCFDRPSPAAQSCFETAEQSVCASVFQMDFEQNISRQIMQSGFRSVLCLSNSFYPWGTPVILCIMMADRAAFEDEVLTSPDHDARDNGMILT